MRFLGIIGSLLLVLACAAAPAMAADQSVSGSLVDILHTKGVIDDNAYKDLKNAEATGGEQTMNRKLIEVLHNKGVIDDATYGKLNEEAAKQAAAPAAPQASPAAAAPVAAAPAERPFDKALTSLEEGFARLGGDTVKLKIGTWTQLGFTADNSGSNSSPLPGSSAVTANSGNQFYTRFARLYFNFTLGEKMGFRIMVDGAGSPPLRDAFIWFDYIPYNRLTIGQFLTPFAETWRAPFDLPMINYSYQAQLMNFGFRDTGALLAGKYTTKVKDMPLGFGYNMALVNGSGINRTDDNDAKDFLGRAWINPLVPGLLLTGEWYNGHTGKNVAFSGTTQEGKEFDSHDAQRWGAEVDYVSTFLPGLQIRGEYLQQRKFYAAANKLAVATDPSQGTSALSLGTNVAAAGTEIVAPELKKYYTSAGWYVQASYRLKFLPGILSNFEPKIRYDVLDEDTSNQAITYTTKTTTGVATLHVYNPLKDTRRRVTLGMNYWLNKYARVLVDYEWVHADSGLKEFSLLNNDLTTKQVITTNLQIWF